jgi:AmiR/NasT family two-component response regulator
VKPRVAVEETLTNITEELKNNGYQVVGLDNQELDEVKAVVVSGQDINMMNMADIKTEVPVINARGMTPEEVRREIEKKGSV